MTKKKAKNYYSKTCSINPDKITKEERTRVTQFLQSKGLSSEIIYRKLFGDGFPLWQIVGINGIKRDFCERHDITASNEDFYEVITQYKGLLADLCRFAQCYAMLSHITVMRKFRDNDAPHWQQVGVKALLDEYLSQSDEKK